MSDGGFRRTYGDTHYNFEHGVQVGGSFKAGALAAHMAELAHRFNIKPHTLRDQRWEPIPSKEIGGVGCDTGYCACGTLLVSATGAPRGGWRCVKCDPFPSDGRGRIDHAEWVRRRRGLA